MPPRKTWTENEQLHLASFDRALQARDVGEWAEAVELLMGVLGQLTT